jgi:hypothetical protein
MYPEDLSCIVFFVTMSGKLSVAVVCLDNQRNTVADRPRRGRSRADRGIAPKTGDPTTNTSLVGADQSAGRCEAPVTLKGVANVATSGLD